LDVVKDRGYLICGCNNALPGFGFLEPDGTFSGFDVDFCRAVAAAISPKEERTRLFLSQILTH